MTIEFNEGIPTRNAYGNTLRELGGENEDIVVLDADLSCSTRTQYFGDEYPDRFWNVGIAEANMVGIASGLAYEGKTPFISSFACFLMCKGYDQLRIGVAYPENNVKVVGSHSGISIGEDGPSQMGIEDISLARGLPGFRILAPSDPVLTEPLVRDMAESEGPVFMRTTRPKSSMIYGEEGHYELNGEAEIGGAKLLEDGSDATIVACGLLVAEALKARERLKEDGLDVAVVDLFSIKPMDRELLGRMAEKTGAFVTAEDHLVDGGMGSRVAQVMADVRPVSIEQVGLDNTYAESGPPDELYDRYGLSAPHVADAVRNVLEKKNSDPVTETEAQPM